MAVVDETNPFVVETESGEVLLVADPEQMIFEATETSTVVATEVSLGIIAESNDEIVLQPENTPVVIEDDRQPLDIEAVAAQGPVGPQGEQGPPGIPGINILPVSIPPANTFQVDYVLADNIEGIEWRLIGRVPTGEMRALTVFVSWDDAWNTYRTVYARVGGGFTKFDIGITNIAGLGNHIQLFVTNNHTADLIVYGTRFEAAAL